MGNKSYGLGEYEGREQGRDDAWWDTWRLPLSEIIRGVINARKNR